MLSPTPAEGVCAVGFGAPANLQQVHPEALKKGVTALWDYSQLLEKPWKSELSKNSPVAYLSAIPDHS